MERRSRRRGADRAFRTPRPAGLQPVVPGEADPGEVGDFRAAKARRALPLTVGHSPCGRCMSAQADLHYAAQLTPTGLLFATVSSPLLVRGHGGVSVRRGFVLRFERAA